VPAPTIFIVRRHWLTVAVSNETDYPMDLLALNRFIAATIATWTWARHPRTICQVPFV
jgi:hypothetical protein